MRIRGMAACAAVFLLCAAVTAPGAMNDWTGIGPVGGIVRKIVFSPTQNTVFASAAAGFYRSQDGGVTWQLISSSFLNSPSDIAVDPTDPTRVYLTFTNTPALLISTDGGATLAPAGKFPANQAGGRLAISPDGKTLCIASGNAQLFCSVDRSQTWVQRRSVTRYAAALTSNLIIDPTDSNTLYIASTSSATTDEIFATHDGGATWTSVRSVDPLAGYVVALAINPANPRQLWAAANDGLWMSGDRGATWTSVLAQPVAAVAIDPVNPGIAYAGTPYGKVFRTTDSGAHWCDVTGNLGAGQINTLAINAAQPTQILVGGMNGLGASVTSGKQWSVQQAGIFATSISGFSADPTTDRLYISVPTGGVYYETGGSGIVSPVNNEGLLTLAYPNTTFYVSAMLAQPGNLWVSQAPWIDSSTDGGNTWLAGSFQLTGPDQFFLMASPAGMPQIIIGAASAGLYRTTNGGATWASVTAGIPANSVISRLLTAPSDPTIAYSSLYTPPPNVVGPVAVLGIYRSGDAGASWAPVSTGSSPSPNGLVAVDPTAANVVYGVTDQALLKSVDSGVTWTTLPWNPAGGDGGVMSLVVDPVHPQILFVSGVARIARSVDGGASWETLRAENSLPYWSSPAMFIDPKRPERLLLGTNVAGVQVMTVAPDLGLTAVQPTDSVTVGSAATYTYTLSNLGPFDATGVHVDLQFPADARGVSLTTGAGTCSVAAGTATCAIGVLRSGTGITVALNATPPAAGSFAVAATVAGDQPDTNSQNNSVNSTVTVSTAPPVTPPPPSSSGGSTTPTGVGAGTSGGTGAGAGTGGGGSLSWQVLLALGMTLIVGLSKRPRPPRDGPLCAD